MTSDSDDAGGEAACFAHLDEHLDLRDDAPWITADVSALAIAGSGALWSLPHGGDLDANFVSIAPGDSIGDHVNDAVDVLVIGWAGSGVVACGDLTTPLEPGSVVLLPRGIRRSIRAGATGVTYFSIHRQRQPLGVGRRDAGTG